MRDVTVVVFSHNQEQYISECLESVLGQTSSDRIKVLVHDDFSSDATVERARKILRGSQIPWEIIVTPYNRYSQGIGFFLEVLRKVETKYIALCDADDAWISVNKLEVQLEIMDRSPQASLSHHGFRPFLEKKGKWLESLNNSERVEWKSRLFFLSENPVAACTALFRTSYLRKVADWSGFDALLVPDYPIWGALALHGEVIWVPGILSKYRLLETSFGSTLGMRRIRLARLAVRRWLWIKYFQSGKFALKDLEASWNQLCLDFRLLGMGRLQNKTTLFKHIRECIAGIVPLSLSWQIQSLLQKVRRNWRPLKRD